MNIADWIVKQAKRHPDKQAVIMPKRSLFSFSKSIENNYESITFEEVEKRSNVYGNGLKKAGIGRGSKVLVFIPPSLEFSPLVFSLFKIGAVPVFIDPGMGVKKMLRCIQEIKAEAMIGISKIHHLRLFKKQFFKGIDIRISVGSKVWGTQYINDLTEMVPNELTVQEMGPSELAAILFTSGGTGKPKGVMYTHEMFWLQIFKLKEMFQLTSKDRDLPGFPLFSMFCQSMGMTSCIPDMNPAFPARVNPKLIVQNIQDHQVTFAAGSPAIWLRVGEYCRKKKIKLKSIKNLIMFGAPVSGQMLNLWKDILPHGDIYTPYGATECLPVALYSGRALRSETLELTNMGHGTCVGNAVKDVDIKVIRITDDNTEYLSETIECSVGEVGEILVHSNTQTPGYYADKENTRKSQIKDHDGTIWHKMGDLGYLDEWGRLWFSGRKAHYFEFESKRFFPVMIEAVINQHPKVFRSAIVPIPTGPAIIIERTDKKIELDPPAFHQFKMEVLRLLKQSDIKSEFQEIYLRKDFPVDARHNIKIDRKLLATWATKHFEESQTKSVDWKEDKVKG
jgi:acyl-CoA synthetase (AMP-forming)/AMP-acid ligase II